MAKGHRITPDDVDKDRSEQPWPYGYGICHCGCGQKTSLARQGSLRNGWIGGQPVHYVSGHNRRAPKDEGERFWAKVAIGHPEDCWEWTGFRNPDGYGHFTRKPGLGMWLAHRMAYSLKVGPIPDGLDVLHRCDNPPCCNPAHLFLGTRAQNVADMDAKGRRGAICGEAHPFARLRADDVREVRRRRAAGESFGAIAAAMGISKCDAWRIATRRAWKSVE